MSCHVSSVNDDVTFVLKPSFFSFAGVRCLQWFLCRSMHPLYIDLPRRALALKSCHNRVYFARLNNNGFKSTGKSSH